jgi:hypothetical protein
VYWPNIYPDDEIFVGNLRMIFSSNAISGPFIYVNVDPGAFTGTVGQCEATATPRLCNCTCFNGCTGDEATDMSYYAAPALVANGSLPEIEARRRVATIETREVDGTLEFIFSEDQRLFQTVLADQGSDLANANARHIAGGPFSATEDCAIQMRVKDCSGNLQVWLRPNITAPMLLSRRRAPALQRWSFECRVHAFGTPDLVEVFPLTTGVNMDQTFPDAGVATTTVVTIGENSLESGDFSFVGVYGFEVARVLEGPVNGVVVQCQLAARLSPFPGVFEEYMQVFNSDDFYCQSHDETMLNNTATSGLPLSKMTLAAFADPLTVVFNDTMPVDVPRELYFFTTPQCPGADLCFDDGWFFDTAYSLTPAYDGLGYAFPEAALDDSDLPTTARQLDATFRFSSPSFQTEFADIIDGSGYLEAGESMLLWVYLDGIRVASLPNASATFSLFTDDGFCGGADCDGIFLDFVSTIPIVMGIGTTTFDDSMAVDKLVMSGNLTGCLANAAAMGIMMEDLILRIGITFDSADVNNTLAGRLYLTGVGFSQTDVDAQRAGVAPGHS